MLQSIEQKNEDEKTEKFEKAFNLHKEEMKDTEFKNAFGIYTMLENSSHEDGRTERMNTHHQEYFRESSLCSKCGGHEVTINVHSSYSPNVIGSLYTDDGRETLQPQAEQDMMMEVWDERETQDAYCQDCQDECDVNEVVELNPEITIGSLVEYSGRHSAFRRVREDGAIGLVVAMDATMGKLGGVYGEYKVLINGVEKTLEADVIRPLPAGYGSTSCRRDAKNQVIKAAIR